MSDNVLGEVGQGQDGLWLWTKVILLIYTYHDSFFMWDDILGEVGQS